MNKELKFKTNIKCMGCVGTVTPALDKAAGAGNWSVDLQSPYRELTVKGTDVKADALIAAIAGVGYKAESI
jgi:copper chaperone CopZ